MKKIIAARDKEHLKKLIEKEIKLSGNECDLNHIYVGLVEDMESLFRKTDFNGNISEWDVNNVTNMQGLFADSKFNGDISRWDVSNVTIMTAMFLGCDFNGDISNWNVSKVEKMDSMFYQSKFNGNVSKWNVSNVIEMYAIFSDSEFKGDLSNWKPYALKSVKNSFLEQLENPPYWAKFHDKEERINAINKYVLSKELAQSLTSNEIKEKKPKI
jgi:surface protein